MKTIHQDPVCLGLMMMMMMTILKLFAVHSKTRYKHNAAELLSELDFWECELHIFNFSAPLPSSPLFLSVCLFEKSPLRHLVYLQVKGDNMKYDISIARTYDKSVFIVAVDIRGSKCGVTAGHHHVWTRVAEIHLHLKIDW